MRDNVPSLTSAVYAALAGGANLQAGSQIAYVHAGRVSAHYFDVLGIRPAVGRAFSAAEDAPKGPKAVILSYDLWHSIFASDRSLIGQTIHLKGEPYTVIGILPQGATTPLNADLYTALQPSPQGEGQGTNFGVIFRLNDGATWQQADCRTQPRLGLRASRRSKAKTPAAKSNSSPCPCKSGMTSELRPRAIALMLAAGIYPADRLRQSRRTHSRAHDPAPSRNRHPPGPGRFSAGRSCASSGSKIYSSPASAESPASPLASRLFADCSLSSPKTFCP